MVPQSLWSEILQVVYKADNAPRIEIEGSHLIGIFEKNFRTLSVENAALATRPLLHETHLKTEQKAVNPNKTNQNIQAYLEPLYSNQRHPELSKSISNWYEFQSRMLKDSYIDSETEIVYLQLINKDINGPLFMDMAYKALVNKMLDLEFATVVSDQIIFGDWEIDSSKEQELIDFINESMCGFGGLSIFLGAWDPSEEDNNPMTRKMELLASIYSVDYSRGYKLNQEGKRIFIEA